MTTMDSNDFFDLFDDFWGPKASNAAYIFDAPAVSCLLYDAFPFRFGVDGPHGTSTAGYEYSTDKFSVALLGRKFTLDSDRESILANFRLADEYCRLRLTDKYLEAFDESHPQPSVPV
ncbi:hypothetical protein ASF62_13945 [Leifsonia sp. Leaf325]|nr:hypothetical protein ASF62_13945 [Leifsonia sp. Leaf325]